MKNKYLLKLIFLLFFIISTSFGQSIGDLAFVGFNADGDRDFAIVTLVDIPTASTIYFTDDETDGIIPVGGSVSGLFGSEGSLTWSTGTDIIKAGTIVAFTDTDSSGNPNFGVSIGTIVRSGSFTISASKDGLITFYGSDASTPTTYICAIQIGNDSTKLGPFDGDGITLTNTGLVSGTTIAVIDNSASPDGGVYQSSRSNQASYASYQTQLTDKANWSTSTTNGETYLNFSTEAFTLSSSTTTWIGGLNTVWNLGGNWDNGVPTSDSNIIIPNVANDPIISDPSVAGNVTLSSDASLTINNTLTNKGKITMTAGSSLKASVAVTGKITYNVNLADTNWHFVSSPVSGEEYGDIWNTNNSIATNLPNEAVSTYDNSVDANGDWIYYQDGATVSSFATGIGYSVKRSASGNLSFTGTFTSGTIFPAQVSSVGTGGNDWNLLGNPYTSYIEIGEFLADNSAQYSPGYQAIYVWDNSANGGTGGYVGISGFGNYLHPGQAFFVNDDAGTATKFYETEQVHQTGVTFYRTTNTDFTIILSITDGTKIRDTKVNYLENKTTGLDPSFDIGTFTGISNNFSLYTQLITDNTGINFMRQSLPNSNYENMIVPIGVNATAGTEITFTANIANIPTEVNVYLEDRTNNTFTKLNENGDYTITINSDSNGIGQFYLRTTSSILNINNEILDNVSLYKTSNYNIRIVGLPQGKASINMYTILGKQVLNKSFQSNGVSDITFPKISKGIYIVQLQTEKGTLNKKISIE